MVSDPSAGARTAAPGRGTVGETRIRRRYALRGADRSRRNGLPPQPSQSNRLAAPWRLRSVPSSPARSSRAHRRHDRRSVRDGRRPSPRSGPCRPQEPSRPLPSRRRDRSRGARPRTASGERRRPSSTVPAPQAMTTADVAGLWRRRVQRPPAVEQRRAYRASPPAPSPRVRCASPAALSPPPAN